MIVSFVLMILPAAALVSALVYLPVYLVNRRRVGQRPFARHLTLYAAIGCALSLIYLTLLWYWPDITFRPEWHFLNLRPFVWVTETYEMGVQKMLKQLLSNVGMFIPLGLLLPMCFPKLRRFYKTALVVLAVTTSIETLQYFMGRSADIDDVIMNLAGGMLGYLAFFLLNRGFGRAKWWRGALGEKA